MITSYTHTAIDTILQKFLSVTSKLEEEGFRPKGKLIKF